MDLTKDEELVKSITKVMKARYRYKISDEEAREKALDLIESYN